MNSRSPTTAGPEYPTPAPVYVHRSFGPPAGHSWSSPVSAEVPSRFGPRYWGQSAAAASSPVRARAAGAAGDLVAMTPPGSSADCTRWVAGPVVPPPTGTVAAQAPFFPP